MALLMRAGRQYIQNYFTHTYIHTIFLQYIRVVQIFTVTVVDNYKTKHFVFMQVCKTVEYQRCYHCWCLTKNTSVLIFQFKVKGSILKYVFISY